MRRAQQWLIAYVTGCPMPIIVGEVRGADIIRRYEIAGMLKKFIPTADLVRVTSVLISGSLSEMPFPLLAIDEDQMVYYKEYAEALYHRFIRIGEDEDYGD